MKKKLDKFDFMAINRRMNQNFNAPGDPFINPDGNLNVSNGDILKLNRVEQNKSKR